MNLSVSSNLMAAHCKNSSINSQQKFGAGHFTVWLPSGSKIAQDAAADFHLTALGKAKASMNEVFKAGLGKLRSYLYEVPENAKQAADFFASRGIKVVEQTNMDAKNADNFEEHFASEFIPQ